LGTWNRNKMQRLLQKCLYLYGRNLWGIRSIKGYDQYWFKLIHSDNILLKQLMYPLVELTNHGLLVNYIEYLMNTNLYRFSDTWKNCFNKKLNIYNNIYKLRLSAAFVTDTHTYTHTHTHTNTHTRARTHARTHAHTHIFRTRTCKRVLIGYHAINIYLSNETQDDFYCNVLRSLSI
jgi:hypothetical protein